MDADFIIYAGHTYKHNNIKKNFVVQLISMGMPQSAQSTVKDSAKNVANSFLIGVSTVKKCKSSLIVSD